LIDVVVTVCLDIFNQCRSFIFMRLIFYCLDIFTYFQDIEFRYYMFFSSRSRWHCTMF